MSTRMSVSVTEESYSVPNNTSSVRVKVNITTDGPSWNETGNTEGYINIDGGRIASLNGKTFGKNTTTTIYNSLHTIKHNTDGTKTISVYVSFNTQLYDGTLTESKSLKLTTISRASTISSFKDFNVEDKFSVGISKASPSYTHDLVFMIGRTKLKTISNYTSGSAIYFTANEILLIYTSIGINNKQGSITANLFTKSGGTTIGSNSASAKIFTKGTARNGNNRRRGIPWVKVNGKWHKGVALVKSGGSWKRGK